MPKPTSEQLADLAIKYSPLVIAALKALFRKENPQAPEPTDADVMSSLNTAFFSSLAKDDRWLAEHPVHPTP